MSKGLPNLRYLMIPALCTVLCLTNCKKDNVNNTNNTTNNPTPTATGNLTLEFQAKVDTSNLYFNKIYINNNADTFTVTKFNYFISNIVLTNSNNGTYIETNSYHLIRHSSGSAFSLVLNNVPEANYQSIAFMLGVDSTRNVSGTQSGDLDPANVSDMFWSWNTGYIFLKLEGSAPKVPTSDKKFQFHIGGYGGTYATQRKFNLNLGSTLAAVKTTATPTVQLSANVNEIFSKPNTLDFKTQYNILNQGVNAKFVADNYADMIRLISVKNN